MKIRVEVSSLATHNKTGVSNYTQMLTESLAKTQNVSVSAHYFNFLNRQPDPSFDTASIQHEKNQLFPLKVYAKLQSHSVAPAFDTFLKKADLTIFPNFATWPTIKSGYRATVVHDLTYLYYPEYTEEKNLHHLRRVVPRSIDEADIVMTVSEHVKSQLIKEFNLEPSRCVVTPIPPDELYYKKNTTDVVRKYKIPTQKYLYFIGTIEPRKNVPALIAAYRALPDSVRKEYSLVLAGGMGWKTEASQAAIDTAVAEGENVAYLGYIDREDANALQQQASLFVTASSYEGFGMPVLEAIASNTPVVASDIPIFREVGGSITLYADPEDPKVFAGAIKKALTDATFLAAFTEGRESLLSQISWEENIRRTLSSLEKLPQHLYTKG